MAKRRPAPILDHDNHERWFRMLELHFKGEGLWRTIQTGQGFQGEFEKDDAKAQYILDICIGDGDRERVQSCITGKQVWDTLVKRYTDKRPSVGRHYLQEYVNYRMPEGGSVQDAWTDIQRLARHVKSSNPAMKDFATQNQMFQQLLAALPPSYDAIRDAIDGQIDMDVDTMLQRLLEKESHLKIGESAHVSRFHRKADKPSSSSPRRRRQQSAKEASLSPERPRRTLKCWACRGDHMWRRCPHIVEHMDKIREIVDKARNQRAHGRKLKAHTAEVESTDAEDFSSGCDEDEDAFATIPKQPAQDP